MRKPASTITHASLDNAITSLARAAARRRSTF
jgi:hypothetical protein